ncbi:MAG: DEAD/DEAH box helicase family protein [Thaumarchaeota archaeon]|nr:DEAD/DEAH box helicase family protein [Nitrososphaerota archaeon]
MMAEEKPAQEVGLSRLAYDKLRSNLEKAEAALQYFREAGDAMGELTADAEKQVAQFALAMRMGKVDDEALKSFFRQPFPRLEPARNPDGSAVEGAWRLIIPRFIPLNVGYLETQDEAWNYFRVNRFMDWFGEIPEFIKKQIGWVAPPDLRLEGEELVGSPDAIEKAWKELRPYLAGRVGDRLLVNKQSAYDLMVALLKKGVKPFSDKPVAPEDRAEARCDYELRDYQKAIWDIFLRKSSVGVFIPPGQGKTVIGVYAATHLKPPHLIVVPTVTLVEQWTDRLEANTDLKVGEDVIVATYQMAIRKFADRQFTLKVYDEVHHLPADYFIKLSWIKAKYAIGLSATPYREDNRGHDIGGEEMIFALTGEPTGLAWQRFKELKLIKNPSCTVWVERNAEGKARRLDLLLRTPMKTIIFSDSLEMGKQIAGKYGIPFVYGASTGRLQTLDEAQTAVVSRVGDEGVSLPELERVIEMSWLFGSRRQELQRFTRLLHSKTGEGEAHIIMTLEEWVHDKKRFYSIMDKGFVIKVKKEGVEEQAVRIAEAKAAAPRVRAPRRVAKEAPAPAFQVASTITSQPGVQKIMARMNKPTSAAFSFLLSKDGQWVAKSAMWRVLGYSTPAGMSKVDFGFMEKSGWVEKKRDGGQVYIRTNVTGAAA